MLARLDPETGETITTEKTSSPLEGTIAAVGDIVAYTTIGGCPGHETAELVVGNLETGQRWSYRFPADAGVRMPSMGHGRVYVAANIGLYAFDAAGCGGTACEPLWTTPLGLDGGLAAIETRPLVGPDGGVYVGIGYGGGTLVRSLDGATGAHLWRTEVHPAPGFGWQNVALAHGQLYVSDHRNDGQGNDLEAFSAAGCGQAVCQPSWSIDLGGANLVGMAVGGDVLYVGVANYSDHAVAAFDARGCGAALCSPRARVPIGDHQPLRMAVAGGRVVVTASGDPGNTLVALGA